MTGGFQVEGGCDAAMIHPSGPQLATEALAAEALAGGGFELANQGDGEGNVAGRGNAKPRATRQGYLHGFVRRKRSAVLDQRRDHREERGRRGI